ncbi:hypothetical protein BH09ACT6_BH09ACT6_26580 [soil metagenome]
MHTPADPNSPRDGEPTERDRRLATLAGAVALPMINTGLLILGGTLSMLLFGIYWTSLPNHGEFFSGTANADLTAVAILVMLFVTSALFLAAGLIVSSFILRRRCVAAARGGTARAVALSIGPSLVILVATFLVNSLVESALNSIPLPAAINTAVPALLFAAATGIALSSGVGVIVWRHVTSRQLHNRERPVRASR